MRKCVAPRLHHPANHGAWCAQDGMIDVYRKAVVATTRAASCVYSTVYKKKAEFCGKKKFCVQRPTHGVPLGEGASPSVQHECVLRPMVQSGQEPHYCHIAVMAAAVNVSARSCCQLSGTHRRNRPVERLRSRCWG